MRQYARNKVELARALGLRYATLIGYFKEAHPPDHSPGNERYDIEAWREHILKRKSAHNFGGTRNGAALIAPYLPNEREQALIEKNKAEAARARFRLAVETGEYLPITVVCHAVETAHSSAKRELGKVLEHELPPRLEGLKAVEIRRVMRDAKNQILDHMAALLAAYHANGAAKA